MSVKNSEQAKFLAKSNPFCSERVNQIPFRFESGNWITNLKRLAQMKYRGAIVGPKGSGKTTLLAQLENHINRDTNREAFLVFFYPDEKDQYQSLLDQGIRENHKGKILLIDGIDKISLKQKFQLFRALSKREGLVVCTHRPMLLPPFNLPTWIKTSPSELLLDYVLAELKMSSPEVRAAGQAAYQKHRGNIRDVLRDLYDRHSSLRFK